MMRARSIGSSIFGSDGSTLGGSAPSFSIRSADPRTPAARARPGRRAGARAIHVNRCASSLDGVAALRFGRDQRGVLPDRLAVLAPEQREAPSAAALRPDTTCPGRSAADPPGAKRSRRRRINWSARARLVGPIAAVFHSADLIVVDRHEGRLAAHGQADVLRRQGPRRPCRRAHRARSRPHRKTET